ncbi:MAG: hypothetical protein CM1200mP12_21240 [Gammaproteobacteria bacterium]|nr:MAG: hypothetical protein CM1200mP12_21240 [Gammaproteobacteria bacterium]
MLLAIKKQLNKNIGNLEDKMESLKTAIVNKPERFDEVGKEREKGIAWIGTTPFFVA